MNPVTFVSSLFVIAGLLLLAAKQRLGWVAQGMGSLLSAYHFGLVQPDQSVCGLNLLLLGIAARSWWAWRNND